MPHKVNGDLFKILEILCVPYRKKLIASRHPSNRQPPMSWPSSMSWATKGSERNHWTNWCLQAAATQKRKTFVFNFF